MSKDEVFMTEHGSSVSWWQVVQRGVNRATSGWNRLHAILDRAEDRGASNTFSGAGILNGYQRDSRYVHLLDSSVGSVVLSVFENPDGGAKSCLGS